MDEYRNQKVLVTGGLGFIGSNLSIRLVQSGASVLIVDSLDPNCGGNMFNIDLIRDDVEVRFGDMRDRLLMRELVRGQDYIFNLAGQVSHVDSMEDPFTDLELNCVAHLSLLEACRHVNAGARIVYSSTRQAYGRAQSLPVTERHLLRPVDINGVNKMAGEWYHMVYHQVYEIRSVSLRLVNTYGPRQLLRHARQGVLGWFIRKAVEGEEIQVFGDGKQLRGPNYVDDVVEALLLAGVTESTHGEVFNLGGAPPLSLEEMVRLLIQITGRGSYRIVSFPPERKAIDIGSFYCDCSKFNEATGWTPRVSLEEGFRRTIEYYEQHHSHYW